MRVLLFQRYPAYRFIADFARDFTEAGHTAEWLPTAEGPRLPWHVQRFRPDIVFCVGASPAVAKAVAGRVPLVFYELDKILNLSLWDGAPAGESDVVFTCYRDDQTLFRRFGFRHVHYLPFCPNLARQPAATETDTPAESGVSFVGSIVREQTNDYRLLLRKGRSALAADRPRLARFEQAVDFLETALAAQDRGFEHNEYRLPAALRAMPPETGAILASFRLTPPGVLNILAKEAAYRQRRYWLEQIGSVDLWGTEAPPAFWPGLAYHGPVDQYTGSGPLFARSLATVNLQRIYARDGLSDRVFNVLGSGGCLLADDSAELTALFEPGSELETFATPDELRAKIERLRGDPERRRHLCRQGRRCIQTRHRFRHRITEMLLRLPGSAPVRRIHSTESAPFPTPTPQTQ